MINKLIVDGQNIELNERTTIPFSYTFAQAQTHKVYFALDNTSEVCAYAFKDCTNLTYISFPPEIERIKRGAFKGCSSLERIPIGENIKYIGKEAFDGCTSLSEVQFQSSEIPDIYCTLPAQTNIYVPNGSKYEEVEFEDLNMDGNTEYFTRTEWNQFQKIPDITFATPTGGPYYYNRWDTVADDAHTIEEKNRVPVERIFLASETAPTEELTNAQIKIGDHFIVTYSFLPENTTNKNIKFFTSTNAISIVETGREGICYVQATDNSAFNGATTQLTAYAESGATSSVTFYLRA